MDWRSGKEKRAITMDSKPRKPLWEGKSGTNNWWPQLVFVSFSGIGDDGGVLFPFIRDEDERA